MRFMKITQNAVNLAEDWGAHAPSRAGDGAFAIANSFRIHRSRRCIAETLPRGRGKKHARPRALPGAFAAICLFICATALAQNAENIADREVQRRQSAIPAGEAALARGQAAMRSRNYTVAFQEFKTAISLFAGRSRFRESARRSGGRRLQKRHRPGRSAHRAGRSRRGGSDPE